MLRKRGLIDPAQEKLAECRNMPIATPLKAYEASLTDNTEGYVELIMSRIRRIIDGCGFKTIGELDTEKITEFLRQIRKEDDLGARTFNHYVQAVESFGNWLLTSKRVPFNPIIGLPRLNAETDVRHARRALTPEEVTKLVDAARGSKKSYQKYSGELRAKLYLFSYLTGLRRKELASLTPESFTMDITSPKLTVDAACSKHRRKDVLPIHPELFAILKDWLPKLKPGEFLFPRLARKKTWFMVQRDLEKAGIPYETEEGIADFHAAGRHSHVTGLLRNGATLVEAKELARHTDVRMTMKYTHIGLQDQAKALANLPAPPTDWQRIGSVLRCQTGLSETLPDTTIPDCTLPHETTNPCESRGCVAECPDLSLVDKESEEWRRRELNPGLGVLQRRRLRV
jgi:integrase